jgi:bacterioferritin
MTAADTKKVVAILNRILEQELAGVVRYTHYSFMVFGPNRIPIVSWLRAQADESLLHAQGAGELITLLGGYPSLSIGPLLDSQQHNIQDILRESLDAESAALALYREVLEISRDRLIAVEEYARKMITVEELHAGEVDKMLRKPGEVASYRSA